MNEYHALFLEGIREFDFGKRVEGQWGLIAKGEDALPLLVALLKHPDPEARSDAAGGLGHLRESSPHIEQALVAALRDAASNEERDSTLVALGQLRSKAALPLVAALIRNEGTDGDTKELAISTLGQIVRRRFDRQPDRGDAARDYLDGAGL